MPSAAWGHEGCHRDDTSSVTLAAHADIDMYTNQVMLLQVKWRAELRDRELERMSMLEREWRRREATRTAEVAQIKAHYSKLDSQTRQVDNKQQFSC